MLNGLIAVDMKQGERLRMQEKSLFAIIKFVLSGYSSMFALLNS